MFKNQKANEILCLTTIAGILIALLTPVIGVIVWILGLGIISLGRILALTDQDIPNKRILKITLSSWALFTATVYSSKWLLILTQEVTLVQLYLTLFTTILIGLILAIESYRTNQIDGIYLIDIIIFFGNYMIFATIINIIMAMIIYRLTSGDLSLTFASSISIVSMYKSGADMLLIQVSSVLAHIITTTLHNQHQNLFERILLYQKSNKPTGDQPHDN